MVSTAQTSNTVAEHVRQRIAKFPRGRIFSTENFQMTQGNHYAVQKSLSRLVEEGAIHRIQNGIYYKPAISKVLKGKVIPPNVNEAVKVIAAKNKETIQLHGGAAANRLGLSTQVPMYQVFHTSGITRELPIAGTKVKFVHTNNKKLLRYADTNVGLAISAMYYLGKELVTPNVIIKIKERLSEQEFEQLRQANLVSWMEKALNVEQKYV